MADSNRDIYRKVFGSHEGRLVLMDMLNDLDFFEMEVESETKLVLQNYAKVILEKMGIWREHNAKRIADALLNMPYMEEEIKSEN